MPLTPEDLMRPRYIVEALYPKSPFFIGEILEPAGKVFVVNTPTISKSPPNIGNPGNYPAIFRRLEWWEERQPGNYPLYVRAASNITWLPDLPAKRTMEEALNADKLHKLSEGDIISYETMRSFNLQPRYFLPASPAEWAAFQAANE